MGDGSWMHYYDPKLKSQLLECRHPTSRRKKKSKTQPCTEKCMLTVSWDYRGIIHQEYVVRGRRRNSRELLEGPKEAETTNKSRLSGTKAYASST
jgi:hypothetical protein